eukprot:TRINITY_DN9104_c0_g1_i1.p1 TRINITY_DN9104_c0_g1~~TRINITY_DN9104_c0_g1_i1.p1  ORF type:complete len:189 (+),score=45.02 TRINITY_DN9104_c0_g1_i1:112-678(+)
MDKQEYNTIIYKTNTTPKRKLEEFDKNQLKKMRSNNFFQDDRMIQPLTNEIKYLSFQDTPKEKINETRKRKHDPVEELIDSRMFSRLKLDGSNDGQTDQEHKYNFPQQYNNIEQNKKVNMIDTPLKIQFDDINDDEKEKNKKKNITVENNNLKQHNQESTTYNTVYTIYSKINSFLKELTFERILRKK